MSLNDLWYQWLKGQNSVNHSTANSSSDDITNGSTYTGEWEAVPVGSGLVIDLKADQNLTVQVEYSVDKTNIDSTLTSYYRTNQIEAPITYTNARPYYRIKVTNSSGSDTTVFRLNTYKTAEIPVLNIPTDGTMAQDYQALSVRPTDFTTEVALGRRQGFTTWNKFGYNADIDQSVAETIWTNGGTLSILSSAETLNVVSTSLNDDDGNTGANSVVITGVNNDWDVITEVVTLDGTNPVTTTNSFLGVNRMSVYLAGSLKQNAGIITATASTAGTVQAHMPGSTGTTEQCFFFVPRNHQFLATYLRFNVNKLAGSSPKVILGGQVFSAVSNAYYDVYSETIDTSVDNIFELNPSEPFIVGEKSVLEFRATSDQNNTQVSCRFSGKLIRDVDA